MRPAPAVRPPLLPRVVLAFAAVALLAGPAPSLAQGTTEDYARAERLGDRFDGLVTHVLDRSGWIGESSRYWYSRSVQGGRDFVLVNAETRERGPAFDHERLAAALSEATGEEYTAVTLPFRGLDFTDDLDAIEVSIRRAEWRCDLTTYRCEEAEAGGRQSREADGDDGRLSSPDGRYDARIRNHNVEILDAGSGDVILRSMDGSEGDAYVRSSFAWSPDSRRLAAYRVTPGYERRVHYVETAPDDQLQPKYSSRVYRKPGDVLPVERPVLFQVPEGRQLEVEPSLFPNAYRMSDPEWWPDGRGFRFEYNQRGHEVYRIISVDGETGEARTVVNEEPETFFSYYSTLDRHYTEDGREIIWTSERDGWKHLYLYDAVTGRVKNRITRGEWVVRGIRHVDEEARTIYFDASGMSAGEDPYLIRHYRIDFDGSNLTDLTGAEGHHQVSWSEDRRFFVDTWSKVDQAPVSVLRNADGRVVMELEQGDVSALEATGWRAPEPFVAKGRDGETDIWGIIVRPTNFDPSKRYPVIESIYAGPHGHFVPKRFSTLTSMMAQAELGFIVVQIDGMGTAHRSKAFHDVAWKNLKDAGFPDRILWHEAVAERYPWYDVSRVGIYGTSAGGQSSLGALLFHPDFYHVAVSYVGCHDNRMDKISWNEQWMGWPLGPHYAESSNVDNAWRLQGKVLLVVGELDTNVDPASTYQVADALIEAGKDFDFLALPGQGHSSGGRYGERRRWDYFVRHLLDGTPPDRNRVVAQQAEAGGGG